MAEAQFARKIVTRQDGSRTMTVFLPDGPLVVPGSHPNFDEIQSAVDTGGSEFEIDTLADVATAVAVKLESLSERVKVDVNAGLVYFDGDAVHDALARHILRTLDQGADFTPLVKFWEKLASNPNPHSREQLYAWLDGRDFTIADDGDFLAYKGCAVGPDGTAVSVHRGRATVDNQPVNGAVPNRIGSVVEFARNEVTNDPSQGCAQGLHVGDYDYASGWAQGILLLVKVNPRDVVSVPTDCSAAKVRVSRYQVEDSYSHSKPIQSAVYLNDPDDYLVDDDWGSEDDRDLW